MSIISDDTLNHAPRWVSPFSATSRHPTSTVIDDVTLCKAAELGCQLISTANMADSALLCFLLEDHHHQVCSRPEIIVWAQKLLSERLLLGEYQAGVHVEGNRASRILWSLQDDFHSF